MFSSPIFSLHWAPTLSCTFTCLPLISLVGWKRIRTPFLINTESLDHDSFDPCPTCPTSFWYGNLFLVLLPNNTRKRLSTVFGEEGPGEVVTNHLSGGWQ